jgi:glutamate/tyrosine decarboxylase-like PLP-dependent enzyme
MANLSFPSVGLPAQTVLDDLGSAKSNDVDWRAGRTNLYVQFGGDDVLDIARRAADLYYSESGHGAAAFPSVGRLQSEVVGWLLSLVHGGALSDGCFTASGSESILLCLKAARDWAVARRPGIGTPKILVPQSAHPAFDKAAGILGLEVARTPLRADYRADVAAMESRICPRTIMVAGSAPQFGHGIIDPIGDIGDLAIRYDLWMHVDACIGALIAPFLRVQGVDVPAFDFSVEGVRSISADIHKYGFGAKGASAALFRHHCWRPSYTFEFDDWPIGSYASSGLAGTRPAGPIAAAWAVMRYLGHEGYERIAGDILQIWRNLQEGLDEIDGVELVCRPDLPVLAWRTPGLPVNAVAAAMSRRGWFVKTMARPSAIHLGMITMHQGPTVGAYLASVRECVAELREAGASSDGPTAGRVGA